MAERVRSLGLGLGLVLGLGLAGCPTQPTTTPQDDAGEAEAEDAAPIIPEQPANHAEGDQLAATIPVIGGGSLELESLRGRPVLLEISASWEVGFVEAHTLYAELLAEHPELAVIVVVADPEDAGLDGIPPSFTLAWDPAGALAAKFSVANLPTMFVLDREGRIHYVDNGWDELVSASISDAVAQVAAN